MIDETLNSSLELLLDYDLNLMLKEFTGICPVEMLKVLLEVKGDFKI